MTRPRPAIDPFHYLTIPTGSGARSGDLQTPVGSASQNLDLDTLLERFRTDSRTQRCRMPDAVLAHDLLTGRMAAGFWAARRQNFPSYN